MHDPVFLGTQVHSALARLLAAGLPDVRYERALAISSAVRETLEPLDATPFLRRVVLHTVTTAVGVYVARFVLPDRWWLLGSELSLAGARPDLAWMRDDGAVLLDEVKTGDAMQPGRALEQSQRHLLAGRRVWGEQLVGVRLLWLSAPRLSVFLEPGRSRAVPLTETPYRGGAR